MEHILWIVIVSFIFWNVITFALYGMDKYRAKNNKWRISEATLIACAFLMGGIGSFLGMQIFRHKTKHMKFRILVPLAVIVNIAVFIFIYTRGYLL
jgi:uncharacterized membrane protein YsdA (DUF1294 family)